MRRPLLLLWANLSSLLFIMSSLPVPLLAEAQHEAVFAVKPDQDPRSSLPIPHSTKSFWFTSPDTKPSPTEGSEGTLTTDADICIIGSGITGVSAAYHMAKQFKENGITGPVKAVILEAREFCSGATGRNGGHLTAQSFENFVRIKKERGADEAIRGVKLEQYTVSEVIRILKENNMTEYVDLVPGGRLYLLFTEEEYTVGHADYLAAAEAGIDVSDVRWLSKEQVQNEFGAAYRGVLTTGNNLWPLKLVSILFDLANSVNPAGFTTKLHTRTPVTSIEPLCASVSNKGESFPRRWSLSTPRGTVNCSYVLHATNAYVSHLLPHMSGPDGVVPVRGQVIATRAAVSAEELTRVGGVGNEGFEYWFPRPVRNYTEKPLVILGGGREVTQPKFELYETDDSTVNLEVGRALRNFLPAVFPSKFDWGTEPEMEWTGIMGYTKSHDPFVGPVYDPETGYALHGQFVSAGYTGHGMPRAFACAQAVSQMIVAEVAKKTWSLPPWLPKSYVTSPSHIEYKDTSQQV